MVREAAVGEGGEVVGKKKKKQQLPLKEKLLIEWPHGCPRRVLHVVLTQPAMIGYEGPAWTRFSFLDAYLGGEKLGGGCLPVNPGGIPEWKVACQRAVGWDWPRLCLQLEARRADAYRAGADDGTAVVFRGGEPHTSRHSAVVGTAMVRLVDALVHGDDDDDDDGGGGYYYFGWEWEKLLLEGTLVFDKSVELQGWRLPAPGEAAGGAEPANVVRGVVRVLMFLTVQ
uniref:Uncharacterized protein n=1 Tax=Oryza punctata TaxID=4537 RepID=A0A0E0KAC8_ORYPU